MSDRILEIIVGPTASGKSSLAVERALATGAEVISVDSVQVYRGLDIGSAKITPEERAGVPHHLIDIVSPDEEFTASDFARRASAAIEEIHGRGRSVILCGGTGLYLSALLYGLDYEDADVDAAFRRELQSLSLEELLAFPHTKRYRGLSFQQIDCGNKRRVIRAIEVFASTGENIGAFSEKRSPRYPCRWTVLEIPRDVLLQRIEQRVDRMLAGGLVEEASSLIARYGQDVKSLQSIGYREVGSYLRGELDFHAMREAIIIATRQYAKRQVTWFKKYAGR